VLAGAIHIARHSLAESCELQRIGAAGVGGLALGRVGEFALAGRFHGRECLVFEEACRTEGAGEVLFELADLQIAGDLDQECAQVQIGLAAVKAAQTVDQGRGDDQHGVGVAVRVADEETGPVGRRRGEKIQGRAEAGEWSGQVSW